jgi:hypothetical protein
MATVTVPYENASSGGAARDEIVKLLRRFGCESVGFMDDFAESTLLLQFTHRGRQVQLKASAKGWAQMYIKAHPYKFRTNGPTQEQHRARAMQQGLIAINSILRDWVKGQVTAVECGILTMEAVFMPHMMLPSGQTVLEHMAEQKLLPAPI